MTCQLCGDICRCTPPSDAAAPPRWMPDAADHFVSSTVPVSSAAPVAVEDETEQAQAREDSLPPGNFADQEGSTGRPPEITEDPSAWREQLSARLSQYRSRRKASPPRYPSLRLPFEDPLRSAGPNDAHLSSPPSFHAVWNQALARDWTEPAAVSPGEAAAVSPPRMSAAALPDAASPNPAQAGAKIIAFPRSAEIGPAPPSDELAEPVIHRPRILDVPEVAAAPPALGGITMEAPQRDEIEKLPGIDIPLHSAPLARRLFATAIDGLILAAAAALFGYVFWKVTAIRPPRLQIFGLAAGVPSLFWAAYQYLLIVYSGSTPGLRLAGLEINRFNGTLTTRRLRRWRVLASYLSAVSLGMGYAWVFLDEDGLCWHDRITHTYLAPKSPGRLPKNPA